MAEQLKEQFKDRDRVIVFTTAENEGVRYVELTVEEARGILISIKDDKAYVLPDGMKTIKVWPLDQIVKEPAAENRVQGIIVAVLTFLADYYVQQGRDEAFSPVGKAKLECINYLLQQEGVEK